MEKEFLEQIAKDHAKNVLTRDEAKTFLKELRSLCDKHNVLLRTDDQLIRFSKNFKDATLSTGFVAIIDKNGNWISQKTIFNHSADLSPTASQMPRLVGLAQASKIYRNLNIKNASNFSSNGNEIAWGTIGNASTSEGVFFEAINAAGVLQVPMIISIWDDGYGISVDNKLQTTKESISEILKGFQRNDKLDGFEILTVKGWDYAELLKTYELLLN